MGPRIGFPAVIVVIGALILFGLIWASAPERGTTPPPEHFPKAAR